MGLTNDQIKKLNRMNRAAQDSQLGTYVNNIPGGGGGVPEEVIDAKISAAVDPINGSLGTLEDNVDEVNTKVADFETRLTNSNSALSLLTNKVATMPQQADLALINTRIDGLPTQLDLTRVEDSVSTLDTTVSTMSNSLDTTIGTVSTISDETTVLQGRASALETFQSDTEERLDTNEQTDSLVKKLAPALRYLYVESSDNKAYFPARMQYTLNDNPESDYDFKNMVLGAPMLFIKSGSPSMAEAMAPYAAVIAQGEFPDGVDFDVANHGGIYKLPAGRYSAKVTMSAPSSFHVGIAFVDPSNAFHNFILLDDGNPQEFEITDSINDCIRLVFQVVAGSEFLDAGSAIFSITPV